MRAWDLRNTVPAEFCEIHVFDSLAIDMNFEIIEKLRSPFRDLALGAVTFIYEWRDDCENRSSWRHFELEGEPSRFVRHRYGYRTSGNHFGKTE